MMRGALGFLAVLGLFSGVALAEVDALRIPVRLPVVDEVEDNELPSRPRTRADCENGPRPCPWISCRHHLATSINRSTGELTLTWSELEEGDFPPATATCSLDRADMGPSAQELVAALMGISVERVRQIEREAEKNARDGGAEELRALLTEFAPDPVPLERPDQSLAAQIDFEGGGGEVHHRDRAEIEAEDARALEAWSVQVVALARGGIPLAAAWAIASHGLEDVGAEDDELEGPVDEVLLEGAPRMTSPFATRNEGDGTAAADAGEVLVDDQELELEEDDAMQTTTTKATNGAALTQVASPKPARRTAEELEALAGRALVSLEAGHATVRDVAADLGIERADARAALNRLEAGGRAHVEGDGKNARWSKGSPAPTRAAKPAAERARKATNARKASPATAGDRELALELLRASPARLKLVAELLDRLGGSR